MPDLAPIYISKQLPKSRPGQPGISSPSLRSAPDITGGANAVTGAMNEAAQMMQQFHTAHERTALNNAKVGALKEISDFHTGLLERSDYENFEPEYKEFITNMPENYKDRFSDKNTWNSFINDFKRQAIATGASITILARKKQVDYGRASYLQNKNDIELSLNPYDSLKAREAVIGQFKTLVTDNVESGYMTREKGAAEVAAFLTKSDLGKAMFDIRANPGGFDTKRYPHLTEKTKIQLQDQANSLVKANKNELKRVQERLRKEERRRLGTLIVDDISMLETTGEGMPGLIEQIQANYTDIEFEGYLKERGRASKRYNTWKDLQFATYDEANDILKRIKPKKGPGYADSLKDYQYLASMHEKAVKTLLNDPHAYTMQAPEVDNIDQSLALQESMGIPAYRQKVIENDRAKEVILKIENLNAEERINALKNLKQEYGKHFDKIISDLSNAGLDPKTELLAYIENPTANVALSEAVDLGKEEIIKIIGKNKEKEINESTDSLIEDYQISIMMTGNTSSNYRKLNHIKEAIKLTAMWYVSKGDEPDDAINKASEYIINEKYNYQDGYRIPKEYDPEKIKYYADNELMWLGDVDPPESLINPDLDYEHRKKQYINAIKNQGGYWATDATNKALILKDPNHNPVKTSKGEIIRIPFEDAQKIEYINPTTDDNLSGKSDPISTPVLGIPSEKDWNEIKIKAGIEETIGKATPYVDIKNLNISEEDEKAVREIIQGIGGY